MSGTSTSDGDANSALAELDQGLRSGRLGEQSEAIVKFPRLFAKYPFPILINSALLKLADIFRQSSNFIRLCVLGVVQQSERHLDKITNVDEFLRRIFAVIHSNDPVARALTLRTLGAVAGIVPEKKQIHHNIRNSLDSNEAVELSAAIYAAGQFASQSKMFAINMCSKISEMIRGYSTPLRTKLQLIPILQHMHHDAHTAEMVRKTCVEILPGYPAQEFVVVTLHTLTVLSTHTLVDVPDQVELLLRHLNEDPRKMVKRQILGDLKFLANQERAHLWHSRNVTSVVNFALNCIDVDEVVVSGALSVLCDLVEHTSIHKFNLEDSSSPVLHLCQTCSYNNSLKMMARSTKLLTLLAINCIKEMHRVNGVDLSSEAVMAIESLFLLINSDSRAKSSASTTAVLKECLHCVVVLCQVQPESCDQFVDIIGGMLSSAGDETATLLCEVLAALGNMKEGVLKLLLPDICNLISPVASSLVKCDVTQSNNKCKILSLLATMLFQTQKGHSWSFDARDAIKMAMDRVDLWTAYRIGRSATRYGHYSIGAEVFQSASKGSSSEHYYFWLNGLTEICRGEALLNDVTNTDLVDRLNQAQNSILSGRTSINASTTQTQTQEFQSEYLRCRSEMLQSISQMVDSCRSLRTSPPPAIASTQAKQSHDDLQRCGRISQLLRQCVKDFSRVGTMFGELYETSFDADGDTLAQLHILQQLNISIAIWIESVCLKSSLQGSIYDEMDISFAPRLHRNLSDYGIDIQDLVTTGQAVARCFERLVSDPKTPPPITNVHTGCLMEVAEILASASVGLPRLFFQSLQQTSLKLAVTPQPRSPSEPIGVSCSQHMAVKVEGVITASANSKKLSDHRKVATVKLILNSSLQSLKQGTEAIKVPETNQTLEQLVAPHNDFFSAQFLIPFAVAGMHQVSIETWLVDSEGRKWRTGLKTSMTIKAFEDGHNRPQANRAQNR